MGKNSIYDLTWIEIYRLVDASQFKVDDQIGVRKGDLDKFKQYNEKVIAQNA